MAKKIEIPELPLSLDRKQFKELTIDELFGLIAWARKRQPQVLSESEKKSQKKSLDKIKKQEKLDQKAILIADEKKVVQEELAKFGDTNKVVEEAEKELATALRKIKTYSEKKKSLQVKLKEFQVNNSEFFSIRKRLHRIEKKEQICTNKKQSLMQQDSIKLVGKKTKLEQQAEANG